MKRYTNEELESILEGHRKWIESTRGERADLSGADLSGANLIGANLSNANLPSYQIPQHGELRVYKAVGGKIVHLLVPRGALRTASLVGRKCRSNRAVVLAIEGDEPVTSYPPSGVATTYEIGETVIDDSYDDDPRVGCTHGIHFFLTREEAEEY